MIRGALEIAEPELVAGWLYSDRIELEGQTVLAFVGRRCIGAGKVGIPRKDLAAAKLGHGRYGFHFPVALPHGEDAAGIVVRLEGSDLSLLQAGSTVASTNVRELAAA